MNLLEMYKENVFDDYMDMVATRDYYLSLTYSYKGVLVGVNGLLADLGYPQRQKDAASVLSAHRLIPNVDVIETTKAYGVFDYNITYAAAERIIAGCHNRIKAENTLREIKNIHADLVGGDE